MGNLCSCTKSPTPPRSTTLGQILTFPEFEFPPGRFDPLYERAWDYVETSPTLLTGLPAFPRHFTHSNNVVDHILTKTLRTLCHEVDADSSRAKHFSSQLRFALREAKTQKDRTGDSQSTVHIPTYHADVYFLRSEWATWQPTDLRDPRDTHDTEKSLSPRRVWKAKTDSFGDAAFFRGLLWESDIRVKYKDHVVAVLEEEEDTKTPAAVFQAVINAARRRKVVINDDGRATISDQKVRTRLGVDMVDQVERLLTNGWCQMLHHQVRLCIITSHECTIVLYINDYNIIEVSDLMRRGTGTLKRPCYSLYILLISVAAMDREALRLPPKYIVKSPIKESDPRHGDVWSCRGPVSSSEKLGEPWWREPYHIYEGDKDPVFDLSFDYTDSSDPYQAMRVATNEDSSLHDMATLDQIGPPSLHLTPSSEYDFQRVKSYDVSHSLIKVRKWPDLLHGPIDIQRLQGQGLPTLTHPPDSKLPRLDHRDTKSSRLDANNPVKSSEYIFRPQSLILGEVISNGALWDVFRVTVPAHLPQPPFPLIGKVLTIDCFEVTVTPSTKWDPTARAEISQSEAREHIRTEYQVLTKLANITPPVIPKIIGLWGGIQRGKEVWVMVMEDVGNQLNEGVGSDDSHYDSRETNREENRTVILNLYDRLHENGILHGDVQVRHWRRRVDDRNDPSAIRLIDFDRAILRSSVPEETWEKYKRREKTSLKGALSDYDYVFRFPPLPSSTTSSVVDDDEAMSEAPYPPGYVRGKELYQYLVETSGSLPRIFPAFPRLFAHSNNFVDNILDGQLRQICAQADSDPELAEAFASSKNSSVYSRRSYSRRRYLPETNPMDLYFQDVIFDASSLDWIPLLTLGSVEEGSQVRRMWQREPYTIGFTTPDRTTLVERGETRNNRIAVLEDTSDIKTPFTIFAALVDAIRVSTVLIDDNGRATISDLGTRDRLGTETVESVQRLLTRGWCQMLHYRVRICILANRECTIVLYIDNHRVEVSDVMPRHQPSAKHPCRSLFPLVIAITGLNKVNIELPEGYLVKSPEPVHVGLWSCQSKPLIRQDQDRRWWKEPYQPYEGDNQAEYDLTFNLSLLKNSDRDMEPLNGLGDHALLDQLGLPSLYIIPSPEYDIKSVQSFDLSHSLGQVRKWPNLLHGPIDARRLQAQSLPKLMSDFHQDPVPLPLRTTFHTLDEPSSVHVFRPQTLLLGDVIAYGALWDVFRVTVPSQLPQPPFALVGKIIAIDSFSPTYAPKKNRSIFSRADVSQAGAREHIWNEFQALSQLSTMDPPVIPQLLGLWGGIQRGKEVWVIVMEDVGERVDHREENGYTLLSDEVKDETDKAAIINMYARLHENGILHGDVQIRHWRRRLVDKGNPSAIRFIDFDRAILRSSVSEEKWNKYKRREQTTIKSIFSVYNYISSFPPLPPSTENSNVSDNAGTIGDRYPLGYVRGQEPRHYDAPAFDPLGYASFRPPWR
ncbi:hypothetical protein M231_03496 [Tremella mesenterica]|uniref:Protein kinase domain-containing protein n=1 Tax=Tremella mesenterica TaxID=5217 RepID=A0A4Q1BN61_TREME|nr:hypothetical protein M231_03496 [Tremella mesenterica]